MSIAHVLAAYVRLAGLGEVPPERVDWALEALEASRSPGVELPAWGYHFDVQTRFFFYPAGSPNVIATSFAAQGLLDLHERAACAGGETAQADQAEWALELALGACEWVLAEVPQTEDPDNPGAAFFGYVRGDRTPIHNSSLLVSAMLARAGRLAGRSDWLQAAGRGVEYALAHQRPDGSWPYAEKPDGLWVDGFHTGYVLDALDDCRAALGDPEGRLGAAHERGLDFYAERLFTAEGAPRGLVESDFPIDSQGAAQGIRTFAAAAAERAAAAGDRDRALEWAERAWRVFDYSRRSLRRRDGAFVFEKRRWGTNRIPHVRWVQAPMLDALARLARLRSRLEQEAADTTGPGGGG